jgi:hypothetical protein
MLVGLLFSHMVQYSKENIVRLKVYLDRPYVTKFETDQVCMYSHVEHTLQRKSYYIFPEKELRGPSPNFHIHVFVRHTAL